MKFETNERLDSPPLDVLYSSEVSGSAAPVVTGSRSKLKNTQDSFPNFKQSRWSSWRSTQVAFVLLRNKILRYWTSFFPTFWVLSPVFFCSKILFPCEKIGVGFRKSLFLTEQWCHSSHWIFLLITVRINYSKIFSSSSSSLYNHMTWSRAG